jgi:enoyl-CoA hydratase/carnithine racemase
MGLGLQRASELALIGDPISPQKMYEWGVVNTIVEPDELISTALKWARKICENSPDSVIVSRSAMLMSLERKPFCAFLSFVLMFI